MPSPLASRLAALERRQGLAQQQFRTFVSPWGLDDAAYEEWAAEQRCALAPGEAALLVRLVPAPTPAEMRA